MREASFFNFYKKNGKKMFFANIKKASQLLFNLFSFVKLDDVNSYKPQSFVTIEYDWGSYLLFIFQSFHLHSNNFVCYDAMKQSIFDFKRTVLWWKHEIIYYVFYSMKPHNIVCVIPALYFQMSQTFGRQDTEAWVGVIYKKFLLYMKV